MSSPDTILVGDVTYIREDLAKTAVKPNGNRCVVVADRGWIFAGDLTEENGRIQLARAINVVRWSGVGFDGMIENPKSDKVVLKSVADVDLPAGAEVFRVPVSDSWGL
jgi:hypothetical protein